MATSSAQKKASKKHLEQLDDIKIRVPKGEREIIKAFAKSKGESLNEFVRRLIREAME